MIPTSNLSTRTPFRRPAPDLLNLQCIASRHRAFAIAFALRLRLGPCGRGQSKMRILGIVALGAAAVLSVLPIHAATADCSDATNTYNSAISDVSDTLRRYTRCLSSSNGSDDCSSEFRRLKNAQSDFEAAVSAYQSECD